MQENFICLIQKKEDAVLVKDFRPISLVLVEQLEYVMANFISPSQSAFIEGRQNLDPVLIANEIVEEN